MIGIEPQFSDDSPNHSSSRNAASFFRFRVGGRRLGNNRAPAAQSQLRACDCSVTPKLAETAYIRSRYAVLSSNRTSGMTGRYRESESRVIHLNYVDSRTRLLSPPLWLSCNITARRRATEHVV